MPNSNDCPPLSDRKPGNGIKQVLVIEDNSLNLKMFKAIIAAQGYDVLEATTGLQGLELACQHHPNLIVTDIRLPDISGLEVIRTLKSRVDTAQIPVLGTSAHALASDNTIQECGCDAFMPKPISIAKFILMLRSLISRELSADTAISLLDASVIR